MNSNSEIQLKKRTAKLSIYSNGLLIVLKLFAGFWSGSVSIISEAIHSSLDLLASIIAFIAVKISHKPADKDHPYGHGKFENVSGVIESLLIFVAAVWIIAEAWQKLFSQHSIANNESLIWGIVVMAVSAAVNFFVSRRLYKVAQETDSVALEADALHLKTDVYTSIGVSLGLVIIYFTSWYILDAIIAIAVALLIIYEAFLMLKKSFDPLLDTSLPEKQSESIREMIKIHLPSECSCTSLKTRKSGQNTMIEFVLITPENYTVKKADEIANHLKLQLMDLAKNIFVQIIIQPKRV
ncbi:MAG: cation transporter [Bacteroidales bacterium]|nr:cation transporter [Bacteroidales bacterium]